MGQGESYAAELFQKPTFKVQEVLRGFLHLGFRVLGLCFLLLGFRVCKIVSTFRI